MSLQGHGYGLMRGKGLLSPIGVKELEDGLAAGEVSYSLAEAFWRKPFGESASNSIASVVIQESMELVNSFEFPILFSSPRSVGERWGVIGGHSSVIVSSGTSSILVPEALVEISSSSLQSQDKGR